MKKALKAALLGVTAISVVANAGTKEFYKYEVINAKAIDGEVSSDPKADIWKTVEGKYVYLYPQVSVRLNDKKANRIIPKKTLQKALVKVIYNSDSIAVYMRWKDKTPSIQPVYDSDAFGDGISVEFPTKFGKGISLPYIGMGDEKHPVTVYLQKNVAGRDYQKSFISEGFGSMTEIKSDDVEFNMVYNRGTKEWTAVIKRPLTTENDNLKAGLVPIGFAIWDGNKYERDGNKSLSRWKFIRLKKYPLDEEYFKYVSWGDMIHLEGDTKRGKQLMIQNGCTGCHRFADQQTAVPGLAPNLSDIGGIAHAPYLKESIVDPSAIIIRNLNINRHYNKSANRDKNGAYPNNDMYKWYTVNPDGTKSSKMPSYSFLPEKDIIDIVAYLKTLRNWNNFK